MRLTRHLALLLAVALLAACAQAPKTHPSRDLFVVLPGAEGKAGSVVVRQDSAEHILDKPYAAVQGGASGALAPATTDATQVQGTFAGALGALPGRPASFVLYFIEGRDELTAASQAELKNVLAEIQRRPLPDLAVIGHTDKVGSDSFNDRLSLARAEKIREMLAALGIASERIQVSGRGKREPLVDTADNVAEAKNRRVEISVR
ncbi:MAG TPA: OmpA family protein [Usitatibacteraceae bacterium]|nr:OmpA family protein [Usitatibacteraceae bacterium]